LWELEFQGDVKFAEVLEKMGAKVEWTEHTVTVTGAPVDPTTGKRLKAIDVDMNAMPDVAMTLAVLGLFSDGPVAIRDGTSLHLGLIFHLMASLTSFCLHSFMEGMRCKWVFDVMSFVNIFVLRDLILQVAKLFAVENWRVKETERMRAIVDELTKVNIFLKKFWFCWNDHKVPENFLFVSEVLDRWFISIHVKKKLITFPVYAIRRLISSQLHASVTSCTRKLSL
jgi:hypothetical protein